MDIHFRDATADDIASIEQLAKKFFFSVGVPNYQIYFRCAGSAWQVALNGSDELVAFNANHRLPIGVSLGYQLICNPKFQGQGISKHFDTMHFSREPLMGNVSGDSIKRYRFDIWAEKLVEYSGFAQNWLLERPADLAGFWIVPLCKETMRDLVEYDLDIEGFERSTFIDNWCLGNEATTLLCYDAQRKCRGYGTLRSCQTYYTLSPLYADGDSIAEALFYQLCRKLESSDHVCMLFPARNRLLTRLVNRLQLRLTTIELRSYQKRSQFVIGKLNMDKVYCMHDYWPL
uniref:Acetyltransf_18 domain-containing protein n=1 Tax=Trichuris muris TaxID=70415 RepID=A0A5S6R1I9_TRIMR